MSEKDKEVLTFKIIENDNSVSLLIDAYEVNYSETIIKNYSDNTAVERILKLIDLYRYLKENIDDIFLLKIKNIVSKPPENK